MLNSKLKINWKKYTDFQKKVFKAAMKIPAGRTKTYRQIATAIGNPKAARAVGNALAKNQDAPIIPCHRVVGSNGIGGYSGKGGIRGKIKLLKKEGLTL